MAGATPGVPLQAPFDVQCRPPLVDSGETLTAFPGLSPYRRSVVA